MRATPGQARDALNQIEEMVERLRLLEPVLRERASDSVLDGWPRQSGPGAGGQHGGDPVGTTVALRLDQPNHDTLGHAHRQVLTRIHAARRLLEQAESTGRNALPPPTGQHFDDGCTSCATIRTWSPIWRTRRCRFCYDYLRAEGHDPPAALIRMHHEGRRITAGIVARLKGTP